MAVKIKIEIEKPLGGFIAIWLIFYIKESVFKKLYGVNEKLVEKLKFYKKIEESILKEKI